MRGMRTRVGPFAGAVTPVIAVIGVVAVVAGCTGGPVDSGAQPEPPAQAASRATAHATTRADTQATGTVGEPAPPARKAAGPAGAAPAPSVAAATTLPQLDSFVSVDVAIGPTSTVVEAPAGDAAADPFGSFAACSGWRSASGNWSLQVSDPGQDVTAVSILTGGEVAGPGTFAASFRVEFVNGAALAGAGTVTLEPGLQAGSFAATDADLSGTFACSGGDAAADDVDAAPGVEVFALLRKGSAERIVNLDEPYAAGDTECAAGTVQVAGDGGIGGDVELAVADGAVALRIGTADLAIDPAHTRVQIEGRAGSFHAVTADGVEIDGAFTCS